MKHKISCFLINLESVFYEMFKFIIHAVFGFIWCILWFPMAFVYSFSESYYPEKTRKCVIRRIVENIYWVLRWHRANGFYTLYGQDTKGVTLNEYIDEKTFWKGLEKLNYNRGIFNQICLLRDKYMFFKYMEANNCPVPSVFGVYENGKFYDGDFNQNEYMITEEYDYFIKEIDGQCASFVKHISDFQELQRNLPQIDKTGNGKYIFQRKIIQASEMNQINPCSLNTLRVITVYNNGSPKVLSALLRIGTKSSGDVDNWAVGGLAIGINEDGFLKKYGFYKPGHGLKTDVHPDTGIVFEKFKIPHYQEALRAACNAHKYFYKIGAIGWDIAITENGPVFVEGNDNFEITLMQACDRPLKEAWLQAVKNENVR